MNCCCLLLCSTMAMSQADQPAVPVAPQPSTREIRIGPGELVSVGVFGVPEFNQDVRVTEDGNVSLPLLGTVSLSGKTAFEAQQTIATALVAGGFFREPQVTVAVKDFTSHGISVLGEVERPGVYPAMSTRRLFDLISLAGGFTPKAGKLVTLTHREAPQQQDHVILTNDPAKSLQSNVEVFPGDTIVVSKAGIVYVVGDVGKPGGFIMENGERMTLLEALAMAQGVNRTAAVSSAKLIRRSSGTPQEVPIALKGILAAKTADIDLMPEDILFVPGSLAKNAFRRGIDSALQIATSVAVYGIH